MTGVEFLGWVLAPVLLVLGASLLLFGPGVFYAMNPVAFIASVAIMHWRDGKS